MFKTPHCNVKHAFFWCRIWCYLATYILVKTVVSQVSLLHQTLKYITQHKVSRHLLYMMLAAIRNNGRLVTQPTCNNFWMCRMITILIVCHFVIMNCKLYIYSTNHNFRLKVIYEIPETLLKPRFILSIPLLQCHTLVVHHYTIPFT
jgi:hypothetical protein